MTRDLTAYVLPDGRVVHLDTDATRGALTTSFQLGDRSIVEAVNLERAIVARLAQVYTVETDQAALIALVADAKRAVRR